jgi:ABC-type methionine transport system ATPase subunit
MTLLDRKVYSNSQKPADVSIKEFADEINSLFSDLEIGTRLVGRAKDKRIALFRNRAGNEFDINGLSSGENQIFCRYMAFRMLEADNAIILIDEPENSLHPAWQQKIIKLYQKIGKNNQIIIATQSPHVIASAPKESIRFLEITDDSKKPIKVLKWNDKDMTDGMPAERILKELMDLPTTRDRDVAVEIEKLWRLVKADKFKSSSFKTSFNKLKKKLGNEDEDIMLMSMEIKMRSKGR